MLIEKQCVQVAHLQLGMYVCELDRSWLETPFLVQGFLIESQQDVEELRKYCEFVYIDVVKTQSQLPTAAHAGKVSNKPQPAAVTRLNKVANKRKTIKEKPNTIISKKAHLAKLLNGREQRQYRDSVTWKREIVAGKKAVKGLTDAIKMIFDDINQGSGLQFSKLKKVVSPLVNSIERNPDACIWLARLKNQDSYIYKHSIASSVWAVAFGRQLGLPPQDLKSLALGAMLLDVGKLEISSSLLNKKDEISDKELQLLRSHVKHSLSALDKSATNNQDVWDMVAYHHERLNGSGYPDQLRGDQISLFAQMAGIVDSYDAMTSDRPYSPAISPSSAIKSLYHSRGTEFDAVLVEEFIQAVGLYPAGTLVLLSSGEVGIVIAEGRTRRLKPQVLLLLDAEKNPLDDIRIINLMDTSAQENDRVVEITQSLEPRSYGIDPEAIQFDPESLPAEKEAVSTS